MPLIVRVQKGDIAACRDLDSYIPGYGTVALRREQRVDDSRVGQVMNHLTSFVRGRIVHNDDL